MWTLRLGTFIEQDFTEKLSVALHCGLSTSISDVDFNYSETIGGINYNGDVSDKDFLLGVFAGASLSYQVSEQTSLFVSYSFNRMEDLSVGTSDREAYLNLSNGRLLKLGMGLGF